MSRFLGLIALAVMLCAALTIAPVPSRASGGSGGGGGKVVELRVTGYVTAIDYVHSQIVIGASYYGTGVLNVTADTKISFDNVSCSLSDFHVGDWAEARYLYGTNVATKLSGSAVPTP